MKRNNIRSKYVKNSLNEFSNLKETLKENTTNAVKDLLAETVRNTYAKLLSEAEDDENDEEYDVEEVEDTDSETTNDDVDSVDSADDDTEDTEDTDDGMDSDDDEDLDTDDDTDEDVDEDVDDDTEDFSDEGIDDDGDLTGETFSSGEDEDGGEWSNFEKYKVSDDEYDFSNAEDDEIVKVYKLLKNDDQVVVKKSDGKINIKDDETGAEYIIDLETDDYSDSVEDDDIVDEDFGAGNDVGFDDDIDDNMPIDEDSDDDTEFELETDDVEDTDDEVEDNEDNEDKNMNESIIYEIALNEYNSNVGYTDNYQNKDVMTNPGMSEPGKNVNDWDAGVPKDSKKPWSGYPGKKKNADKPFNAGKGKTVEEEDETLEEQQNVGGAVQKHSMTKTFTSNSSGRKNHPEKSHCQSIAGKYEPQNDVDESIKRKVKQIMAENKELKTALTKFKSVLQEAAVTNVNLGQIIKLITENSTTADEKKEIIKRFGRNANTIKESKNLYETISDELKRKNKMNISEERQFTTNGSKQINETQIYLSKDALDSLDLMHRMCK